MRFSERVAQGDFRPESAAPGVDELDALLASLNRTADALRTSFESLTAEKNQGATILSSMVEGVAVLDRDLRIEYLNGAFRELLSLPGGSWREYRGRKARGVLEAKRLVKMVKAAMRGKSREREVAVAGRDILARAAPVRPRDPAFEGEGPLAPRDRKRAPVGAVLVLMDVTRLRALERVRRDFVANLSHELKTPIAAIRALVETLIDDQSMRSSNRAHFLSRIRNQSIRLSSLVTDLLTLSRLESSPGDPELGPIDLREPFRAAVQALRPTGEERGIVVHSEVSKSPVRILGDPEALVQLTTNLLDNAIKYTNRGGQVRARLKTENGRALIEVQDTGMGIAPQDQARVFERFYRVDKARSRELGGTGLGLSIVKHIAAIHQGQVLVESSPGIGSTFRASFPVHKDTTS